MLRPILFALAAASLPSSAIAAPSTPTSKWHMEYSPTACTAKRAFGDEVVAITPSPMAKTTMILVEAPGKAFAAKQVESTIDAHDGSQPIGSSSLIYPTKRKGHRGIYTIVPTADAERIFQSGKLDIFAGKKNEREMRNDRSLHAMGVLLDLGPMTSLRRALDVCMKDLQIHWGMIDGKIPEPPNRSGSTGDVRSIFRHSDYPDEAAMKGLSGKSRFVLMIGKDGSVMDCSVVESSGVASLDAMGCQVLRARAKFTPARDAKGDPTIDTFITPIIAWAL